MSCSSPEVVEDCADLERGKSGEYQFLSGERSAFSRLGGESRRPGVAFVPEPETKSTPSDDDGLRPRSRTAGGHSQLCARFFLAAGDIRSIGTAIVSEDNRVKGPAGLRAAQYAGDV